MPSGPIPPKQCASLTEIRDEMDAIDRQIVALIARRVEYVRAAAQFKTSAATVAAPERVAAVLQTRREWAEAAGVSGDVVEGIYRALVEYSISEEHKRWHEINQPG